MPVRKAALLLRKTANDCEEARVDHSVERVLNMVTQIADEMSHNTCHILLHGDLTPFRSLVYLLSIIPYLDGASPSACGVDFPGIIGHGSTGTACCSTSCINDDGVAQCGGPNCTKRDGGYKSCCVSSVIKHQESCDVSEAPCWIGERLTQRYAVHMYIIHATLGKNI